MKKTITNLDRIDEAVKNLTEQIPQIKLKRVFAYLALGLPITNENISKKVRKEFKDIDRTDLIREMISNALVMSQPLIDEKIPFVSFCKEYVDYLDDNDLRGDYDEIIQRTKNDPKLLSLISVAFVAQRYHEGIKYEDMKITDEKVREDIIHIKKTNKERAKTSLYGKINNFYFNKTKVDVVRDAQVKRKHIDYQVDNNMYASMDIGEYRSSLNDGVLMIDHPKNYKFRLISVASNGVFSRERISNEVLRSLLKWFENLSVEYYEDIDSLKELLENKLMQINYDISSSGKGSLTCAIIGKDKTLIYSIGDTRGYKVVDNKLINITDDDTYIGRLCAAGIIERHESRFLRGQNLILNEIGESGREVAIKDRSEIIPNSDYDKLLFVSRGITKTMDDRDIEAILAKEEDPEAVKAIVKKSVTEGSVISESRFGYETSVQAGVENSSAVMYVKRK
jgi:protein phosphatase